MCCVRQPASRKYQQPLLPGGEAVGLEVSVYRIDVRLASYQGDQQLRQGASTQAVN